MICSACGKVNIDSAAFCEQCGARMSAQPAINPGVGPGTAAPGAAPVAFTPPPTSQVVPMANALIASLSMGEKISGAGAIAAVVSFFLPWISAAMLGTSASGLDLGKTDGATYLILLLAIAAGALCYLSSKAAPAKKLMFAGYLVLIGALCGPALLLSLVFVSQLSSVAGFGLWLLALGYTAIASGGLYTIRGFSSRTY
jgi:hypothetical protein